MKVIKFSIKLLFKLFKETANKLRSIPFNVTHLRTKSNVFNKLWMAKSKTRNSEKYSKVSVSITRTYR